MEAGQSRASVESEEERRTVAREKGDIGKGRARQKTLGRVRLMTGSARGSARGSGRADRGKSR